MWRALSLGPFLAVLHWNLLERMVSKQQARPVSTQIHMVLGRKLAARNMPRMDVELRREMGVLEQGPSSPFPPTARLLCS